MLTQQQRDTFRLALASLNAYSVKVVDELDIDDVITDEEVVETCDTVEDFFAANGRRLTKKGERPAIPFEKNRTLVGDVYQWNDIRTRKGARRGSLFVMDFGDARAAFFDGEILPCPQPIYPRGRTP